MQRCARTLGHMAFETFKAKLCVTSFLAFACQRCPSDSQCEAGDSNESIRENRFAIKAQFS